jgi:hypothetical protein
VAVADCTAGVVVGAGWTGASPLTNAARLKSETSIIKLPNFPAMMT